MALRSIDDLPGPQRLPLAGNALQVRPDTSTSPSRNGRSVTGRSFASTSARARSSSSARPRRSTLFFSFPYWRYFKLPVDRALDRSMEAIETAVRDFMEETRRRIVARPELREEPENFLESMIAAQETEGAFTDEESWATSSPCCSRARTRPRTRWPGTI